MKHLKSLKKAITINHKKYEVDLSKVPTDTIEKLRASFIELDEDQSGHIGVPEIMEFLEGIGQNISEEEVIENYFDENDKDNDFQLDFTEFVMRFAPRTEIIDDLVITAFRNFAPVRSEFIDVSQLKRVLMNLGTNKFSEEEFNSAAKYLSLKENGKIEFIDFVKTWREKAKVYD
jgi:Ca2+-binding EF-hand superfamily protein